MEIQARRWLAVLYRCPNCGSQTAHTRLTPTKRNRDRSVECHNWRCRSAYQVIERRYYTTFVIEEGVSYTAVAGTLERIGPFKVCDYMFPNIRVFKRFVATRRVEMAKEAEEYQAHWRRAEALAKFRQERERKQAALLKEAERVAYRREHAVELLAEQIAAATWPQEKNAPADDQVEYTLDWDEHPF